MADDRKRRGPYLQYLSDSSTGIKVPRTTKYRWKKKAEVLSMNSAAEQEPGCIKTSVVTGNDLNISSACEDFCVDSSSADISNLFSPSDDFQSHEMSSCDDTVKETCTSNISYSAEKTCGFKAVSDEILMTSEPALYTDCAQDDPDDLFADDFLDDMETYTDEETDEMSASENHDGCKESSDNPLYPGCRLSLGISMLLIVTFCIRHALSGVALSDLLTLVELHCLLPNHCAKTAKLLREFFGKLKSPIELHYYCSFCQEYFGTQKPSCCSNTACLLDFEKKRSELQYFIIIPFITQLQAILRGELSMVK